MTTSSNEPLTRHVRLTACSVEAAPALVEAAVDELDAACGPGERAAVERILRGAADLHRAFGRAEPR
jgi:hypothetical protein